VKRELIIRAAGFYYRGGAPKWGPLLGKSGLECQFRSTGNKTHSLTRPEEFRLRAGYTEGPVPGIGIGTPLLTLDKRHSLCTCIGHQ